MTLPVSLSPEQLLDLIEQAADLVQSVDLDGRFLYINRCWRETLGYSPEDVGRLRLWDVIRPDHREGCGRMFEALLAGAELPLVETVFVARDGREVELEGRVMLARDAAGRPSHTRGIFRDVTELRAARRRIDELLTIARAVIERAPVGISVYDPGGQCVEANEALARIVGGSVEQVRSLNFCRMESWRRHGLLERAETCLARGEAVEFETRGETTFGRPVHLQFHFVPLDLPKGRHLLVLTEDRTVDRRREQELLAYQQRLTRLGEVAREIAEQVDLRRMLQAAVDRVRQLARAEIAAVVRIDPETGRAADLVASGISADSMPPGTEVRLRGLLGRVASGETIETARAEAEPDFEEWPGWHPRVGPMLGLPLRDGDRVVAIMMLGRAPGAEPFDATDRQLAEMIADLVVVAIRVNGQFVELQRLNRKLNELATTDALMGVANRRAFEEALALQHATAQRYGVPYGLLIADIDHFKQYNDRYGHPAGDRVLAAVAGLFRGTIRRMDGVFRYGGEELVFLLPHQRREGTLQAAERLRRCVEEARIEHAGSGPGVVTVSFGAAVFDPAERGGEKVDAAAVVREADEALYRAKERGRNRVETAWGAS